MVSKRELQKEQRREHIIDVSLELFIRKGYDGTKIADIARAADMSVGLLFHYFESKEALYAALIDIGTKTPRQFMSLFPAEDPAAYFADMADQLLQYMRADSFTARMFVLMHRAYSSDATPAALRERLLGADYYGPSIDVIRRGQQMGQIRDGDPAALAIAFWGAIQGIAETLALSPPGTPCPEGGWIADIIRRRD